MPAGFPGPPIGPLAVSEITKHTCALSWNPPKYDGGLRITHYIVERKDVNSNHWICISTTCKDTHFIVQGLTEGNEYVFRIIAVNDNGLSPPLEGVNPIKAKSPYGNLYIYIFIFLFFLIDMFARKYRQTIGARSTERYRNRRRLREPELGETDRRRRIENPRICDRQT